LSLGGVDRRIKNNNINNTINYKNNNSTASGSKWAAGSGISLESFVKSFFVFHASQGLCNNRPGSRQAPGLFRLQRRSIECIGPLRHFTWI